MTPWQLANTSELSQQTALFCYCAKAFLIGFKAAKNPDAYKLKLGIPDDPAVPELAWLHSVPNGVRSGDLKSRMIEGARLRGSGVKAGILDIFWALARGGFHGLYIEMKVGDNTLSPEQIAFRKYAEDQGYCVNVCYSWVEAAEVLETYYNLGNEMKASELISQLQKIVVENGDATISCYEFSDVGTWSETKSVSEVKFYQDTWKGDDEWVIE